MLKNTNTKIIHRIFAADDKEAVGNTVMLKEEQKDFLSNLPAGRAVYFTTGTEKAVQIQIKSSTDTSAAPPSDDEIRLAATKYYLDHYRIGLHMGLELFSKKPTAKQFACIRELNNGLINTWNIEYLDCKKKLSADTLADIKRIVDIIGAECLCNYMTRYENVHELRKYIIRKFM